MVTQQEVDLLVKAVVAGKVVKVKTIADMCDIRAQLIEHHNLDVDYVVDGDWVKVNIATHLMYNNY